MLSTRATSSAGAAARGPQGTIGDVDLAPAHSTVNASAIGALGAEDRYARIKRLIATDRCVLLDGATGTELIDVGGERPEAEEHLWGVTAILDSPDQVKAVHRRYVDAGCDVISTNTWGLPTALREGGPKLWESLGPIHWMDVARGGVRLARAAAEEAQRAGEVAVAFSINGDVDTPDGRETIRLLARAFEQEPPDLILLETLSLVRTSTYATVETLLATGLPVWLSFRRCRHGVCGVYGEHWGGPEGDSFGRAARRFEEMGVGALSLNCVPPDHVTGMLSWLRDFTDLPLGVYPNLGYLSAAGWRHELSIGGDRYAELALQWRAEGAQIIGGCCGVGPEHLTAARGALASTKPGHLRPAGLPAEREDAWPHDGRSLPRWTDARGRTMFPLDFPDVGFDPGVFVPTQPVPDAGRPVRAGHHPPSAGLLGPQPARPPDSPAAPAAGRRRHRVHHAVIDHRRAAHRAAARAAGLPIPRRRLRVLRVQRPVPRQARADRARGGALRCLPPAVGRHRHDGRLPD